jgi:[acyl-carrier-protein] S-malonyltransferase
MFAAVFPGQGSQKPGMGRALHEAFPEARAVFTEVSDAAGTDVARLCFESDDDTLCQTQNAQLALYTSGVAAYACLFSRLGAPARAVAGHSIGEYAALAAADVLDVADGARLVKLRGELMATSGKDRPGTMAAVLGFERADLEAVCREASTPDSVAVIANDNCPGQLVISGDVAAVERAGKLASERGAKRVLPLNVSGAFHSPLMEEPARRMGEALRKVEFTVADWAPRVYSNVTAEPADVPNAWPLLLETQLKNPVRWTESVRNIVREQGARVFVECGVGEVLSGLIRRIDGEAVTLKVNDPESLEGTIEALAASGVRA